MALSSEETNSQSENLDKDFYFELRGKSERAAAIFAAALLDELLRKVLISFSNSGREASRDLQESQVPENFSRRINLAKSMGLITSEEENDLNCIRLIRNSFVHAVRPPSFENDEIREIALRLKIGDRFLDNQQRSKPRELFQATAAALAYSLSIRIHQVDRPDPYPII